MPCRIPTLLLTLLATACGGQVVDPGVDGGVAPEDDIARKQRSSGASEEALPDGIIVLEECALGFERFREPNRRCDWVFEARCYETKEDACACACPNDGTLTTCLSGFPEPDGRTRVTCS